MVALLVLTYERWFLPADELARFQERMRQRRELK